ncbi:MAG: hypothetical protein AAGI54_13510 [Planctomycetota bacterium]
MTRFPLAVFAVVFACLLASPARAADVEMPTYEREVALKFLDQWTGSWEGTFVVYHLDGRVATTLHVRQRYWWEGDTQRAEFHETDADTGDVTTADARNFVDDRGRLVCVVEKSTGETTTHYGRITGNELFWFNHLPGRVESFREAVQRVEPTPTNPSGNAYTIAGFGVYGTGDDASHFTFAGRYDAVAE